MEGKVAEVFKEVKPVFDAADLRVVQWETTITESETPIDKTGPNLKVPYSAFPYLFSTKAVDQNLTFNTFNSLSVVFLLEYNLHEGKESAIY